MNMQAAPDYFELADYTSVLRRRMKSIVTFAILGVVLSGAYVVLAHKTYTATVLVQVNALPNNANAVGGRTGGPVNMDNEAQSVHSAAVAAIVKSHLHSPLSLTAISNNINVAVPPNSTFLRISCSAQSAAGAQKCANVAGGAYLYNRRVSIMKFLGSGIRAQQKQAGKLRRTIETLKATLFTTRHKKGNLPGSPTIEGYALRLTASLSALAHVNADINSALPLYASMAAPDNTVVGAIASPATLPVAPSSPRKLLYVPSGLILGLVVGVGLAFLNDRSDKRVHSVRDVERFGRQPTLLSLSDKRWRQPSTVESPRTAPGRAYAELAQVVSTALGDGGRVLAVAATSAGTSASVVAANLAAALARTTDETVLVCGDLQGTRAPKLLGANRGRGLSEVLTGAANVKEVLAAVKDVPRLRVIAPGLDAARAAVVMQQATVRQAVGDLLAVVRYVIIEVQSVGDNSDTFSLAHFADAAIIAVELGRSRPDDIADCANRLDRLGARVLGTAIVPAGPVSREARKAAPPPQDRPYVGAIKPYELTPEPGSLARDPQKPIWNAGAPKPSGAAQEAPNFNQASAGGMKETMPRPRFTPHERGVYPNPADPATGD